MQTPIAKLNLLQLFHPYDAIWWRLRLPWCHTSLPALFQSLLIIAHQDVSYSVPKLIDKVCIPPTGIGSLPLMTPPATRQSTRKGNDCNAKESTTSAAIVGTDNSPCMTRALQATKDKHRPTHPLIPPKSLGVPHTCLPMHVSENSGTWLSIQQLRCKAWHSMPCVSTTSSISAFATMNKAFSVGNPLKLICRQFPVSVRVKTHMHKKISGDSQATGEYVYGNAMDVRECPQTLITFCLKLVTPTM